MKNEGLTTEIGTEETTRGLDMTFDGWYVKLDLLVLTVYRREVEPKEKNQLLLLLLSSVINNSGMVHGRDNIRKCT